MCLGKNCELPNFCYPSPCANGGSCSSGDIRFDCNCTDTGFTGLRCHIPISKLRKNGYMHFDFNVELLF